MKDQTQAQKPDQIDPSLKPNENEILKHDWPIGPLPDAPQDKAEQEDHPQENPEQPQRKASDNGFDEWSVSWP
jgi:hypothetical protein